MLFVIYFVLAFIAFVFLKRRAKKGINTTLASVLIA